jgi:prepilin-type N-terminal cleavage/methylation domain-containing protein
MMFKKGYTLFELIIVMAIMALLIVIAIPAYNNYGKKQAFRQKTEEMKELINQAYLYSRNPQKEVARYEIIPSSSDKKVSLVSCGSGEVDTVTGTCLTYQTVKEVTLTDKSDVLSCATAPGTGTVCYALFPADSSQTCTINTTPSGVLFSFSNSDAQKNAIINIKTDPFSVSANITDN